MEKEKNQLQLDFKVTTNDLNLLKRALEDKYKALAEAKEKTETAEKMFSAVSKLEENTKLKQERADWSKKLEQMTKRRNDLENYLGNFAKKMFDMLTNNFLSSSEFPPILLNENVAHFLFSLGVDLCQDFDKETEEIKPNLDPTKSPVGDVVSMNMFRVDTRLKKVQEYVAQLRATLESIDKEVWPEDTLETDLESMMDRLNQILD